MIREQNNKNIKKNSEARNSNKIQFKICYILHSIVWWWWWWQSKWHSELIIFGIFFLLETIPNVWLQRNSNFVCYFFGFLLFHCFYHPWYQNCFANLISVWPKTCVFMFVLLVGYVRGREGNLNHKLDNKNTCNSLR